MGKASRKKVPKNIDSPPSPESKILRKPSNSRSYCSAVWRYPLLLIVITGLFAYLNSFNVPFHFDDLYNISENSTIKNLDNFLFSSKGYNLNPRRAVGYFSFALNYHFGGLDVAGYHIVNLVIHIVNGILVYLLVLMTFRTPYFSRNHPHPNPPPSRGRGEEASMGRGQVEASPSSEKMPEENSPLLTGRDKVPRDNQSPVLHPHEKNPPPLRGGDKGEGVSRFTIHPPQADPPGRAIHDSRFLIALFSALFFVAHPVQTQSVTYIVQRFTSLAAMFYLLSVVLYIRGRLGAIGNGPWATPLGPPFSGGKKKGGVLPIASLPADRMEGRLLARRLCGGSPLAWFFLSLLFAVCAMKTKEIAFTLPIVVILHEFLFFKSSLKKKLAFLIPVLLTLTIIPLSIMGTDKPLGEILSDLSEKTRVQSDISRWDYLLTQMRVIVTYIRLLFFPVNQNLDYDYPIYRSFFDPAVMASFVFLGALIGAAVYLLYKSRVVGAGLVPARVQGEQPQEEKGGVSPSTDYDSVPIALFYRLIAFGIFWFFITLSVESSLIPIADVIFEHRLYLPTAGAFAAITAAVFLFVKLLARKFPRVENGLIPFFIIVTVFFVATAYFRNEVWKDPLSLWADVVAKSPGKARGHNNLGIAYASNNSTDRAEEHLKRALQIYPDYAEAHSNLGVVFMNRGFHHEAKEHFNKAIELSPNYTEAYFNLGLAYASEKQYMEAVGAYKKALTLSPGLPVAHFNLAKTYADMGKTQESVDEYLALLQKHPTYAAAYNNLGELYIKTNEYSKALVVLEKAVRVNPDLAEAYNNMAVAHIKQKQYGMALAAGEKATRLRPDFAEAYLNLGGAYKFLNRPDKAGEAYKKALSIKPELSDMMGEQEKEYAESSKNGDAREMSIAVADENILVIAYIKQGRYEEALSAAQKAVTAYPDSPETFNNLSTVYRKLGKYDEAIDAARKALAFRPDYAVPHNNLGLAYAELKQFDEATASFKKAISLDPDYAEAYSNLGALNLTLQNYDASIQAFKKALKINPDYVNPRFNLSVAYHLKGDRDAAMSEYLLLRKISEKDAENLFSIINKK